MKLAFAVGTLVAGKRLSLDPRALADLVNQQLRNNPQFKEIGDQLREDLRGVGKAASGAMVERQMNALADRLHDRSARVRDELTGVVPDASALTAGEDEDAYADGEPERRDRGQETDPGDGQEAARASAKKSANTAKKSANTAPAQKATRKTARKAPAKKAATQKTAPGKTATRPAARASGGSGDARSRRTKGGGER